MTDTKPTHCGHDPRFVVSADEGTAYCAMCELISTRQELARARLAAQMFLGQHNGFIPPCACPGCRLSMEILK